MAAFVQTGDVSLVIDPSVALGPSRYGLSPHPLELQRKEEHWERIQKNAGHADILSISHYHYDHLHPTETCIYKGKILLIKHPERDINKSQKGRAREFLDRIKGLPKSIEYADDREFKYGSTVLKFSNAVPHGVMDRLGYVVMLLIDDGDQRFLHTSDVQGPSTKDQTDWIISQKPDILMVDGPLNWTLERARNNLIRIIKESEVETIMLEHHGLRDLNWKKRFGGVLNIAEDWNVKLCTGAEFAGEKEELLEANRKKLYHEGAMDEKDRAMKDFRRSE